MSPFPDPAPVPTGTRLAATSSEARRAAVLAVGAVLALRAMRVLRRHRNEGRLSEAEYDAAVEALARGTPRLDG